MAANVVRKIKIFYSYAHEDKAFRDGIERHLATLRRLGQIITWYDREILPGSGWAHEINTHLESSDIILLLISSFFIDSDYCWGKEMTRALERHNASGIRKAIDAILKQQYMADAKMGETRELSS
jgi:TIR domain